MAVAISEPQPAEGTALRGREAERRLVGELLRRAGTGIGGVLLIDGERGVGKSAVLREAEREASARGFSLAAAASQLGGRAPYGTLRSALGSAAGLPGNDERRPEPGSPESQITGLRQRLARRTAAAPVLVTLDDLHRESPETLLALCVLPRELARHPVAWILARSAGAGEGGEQLFRSLEAAGARRITLAPLAHSVVAGMLTEAFGAPPDGGLLALAAGAAGNPLLLGELVSGLRAQGAVQVTDGHATLTSGQLPPRLQGAARSWLGGLSASARRLMETAAVLGVRFRIGDIAEILGVAPAALLPDIDEAFHAGIVAADDDTFSFRHGLLAAAVADLVPRPVWERLHRRFGEILLSRDESPDVAAGHLLRAARSGDPASLADLDRGAARVLGTSPRTAADLALRALRLTDPADESARPRAVAAAEALTAAGQPAEAARIVYVTLAHPVPPHVEARLLSALSAVLGMSGQAHEAAAYAEQVISLSDRGSDTRDRALSAWLQAATWLGDARAACRALATAGVASGHAADVAAAGGAGGHATHLTAAARTAQAMVSWDEGSPGQSLELLREAARDGGVAADARHCQPLLLLSARLIDLRRLGQAASVLDGAARNTPRDGLGEAIVRILRARIHLAKGALGAAAGDARAALTIATDAGAGAYSSAARTMLGAIDLRRGDLPAAACHASQCPVPPPHAASVYAPAETAIVAVRIRAAADGPDIVAGQVQGLCASLPALRRALLGDPALAAWLVRTALAVGDYLTVGRAADEAGNLASRNAGYPALSAAAAHARGVLAQDTECLERALSQHQDLWARASAAEDLGIIHADRPGQAARDRAVEYLGRSLEDYAVAGAAADVARVRARLREFGVRRRHRGASAGRPVTGWKGLTSTERAVAELVAEGLTNQEIADRVYISTHTVAHHLRQAFRKLDIGSRVELACVVVEQLQRCET
jgi:DNA-binding CsgD family transcriptional regulator/tetratricopeptide (TPR) repeat protein